MTEDEAQFVFDEVLKLVKHAVTHPQDWEDLFDAFKQQILHLPGPHAGPPNPTIKEEEEKK